MGGEGHVNRDVLLVLWGGGEIHVINQAQETIDKIVPGPWIVMQAAVKKCAVNGG